jgi:hypothetical protein
MAFVSSILPIIVELVRDWMCQTPRGQIPRDVAHGQYSNVATSRLKLF